MPAWLVCACGARLNVDDAPAGEAVVCPQCGRPVRRRGPRGTPLRTSGYALTSIVLAFMLAFTVVGTLAAIVLGLVGLADVRRHPDRVTGAGYAVGGIVLGTLFTGLTVFAIVRGEVFDQVRDRLWGNHVDRSGPMEVVRAGEGFAITRPTARWGVAGRLMVEGLAAHCDLMLADPGKDAYIDVTVEDVGNQTIERCRERLLGAMRADTAEDVFGNPQPGHADQVQVRGIRRLPAQGAVAAEEVELDVRYVGQPVHFLIRLFKDGGRLFTIRGWASARRFPQVGAEIRKGLESFRVLDERGS